MDYKEFRDLLLLLREDLEDSHIPHRNTVRKRILQQQNEQFELLSAEMRVSNLFNFFLVFANLFLRITP